jgi:hypothetical protein
MIYLELGRFCLADMEKLTGIRNKLRSFTHTTAKSNALADNFKQVKAAEQAEFTIDASLSKFKFKLTEENVNGQFFMI